MSFKWTILSAALASALLISGCSKETAPEDKEEKAGTEEQTKSTAEEKTEKEASSEPETVVKAYTDAVAELDKAKEDQEVDFSKVEELYKSELQTLVKQRDAEFDENIDQTITAALEAGKNEEMNPVVVRQLFDKLMQKEFFQTMRHEFTEIDENWGNKEEVMEEYEEAMSFYGAIEGTVEKRDAAYESNMQDVIAGGFDEMKKAIESEDKLSFSLGKQVVDKTLMKTFYYAVGALPNGYATKASEAAKTDETEAKIEQAEGWAFYQSVYPYLQKHAAEDADYILKQLDLQTDAKTLDAEMINKAFVRGFAKIALHEYEESKEAFGEEKGSITAIEGALFINIIENDIKTILGEEETTKLTENAQGYLDAAKANDKEAADQYMPLLEESLNNLIEKAK
ncbi:hypothetical protein [Peribacillus frigoritolerans]|uniref:hypothetical protein n=1 Tax=Peribacillus frigoritolerans TaxID=450367 RepID=UPI001059F558|nr:hypothetical protein [Peribacillus frigoritolerans]TDL78835.1 hypothetical protein E2R53_15430 [Peribacillus frigoritolerans]